MKSLRERQAKGTVWSGGSQNHHGVALLVFFCNSLGSALIAGLVSRLGAKTATEVQGFSSPSITIIENGKTFIHISKP